MGILKPRSLFFATCCFLVVLGIPFSANSWSGNTTSSPVSVADEELKLTGIEILNALKLNHYTYIDINDNFSSQLLHAYLKNLDPAKLYLLASDIEEFDQYEHSLDDALNKGDLRPAFLIYNRYKYRVESRLNWLIAKLDAGLEQFDFNRDDSFDPMNKNASWAASPAALDQQWHMRLKSNVLDMRLDSKKDDEIIDLLKKRYEQQLKRLERINSRDAFAQYINVVTQSYDPHTEYLPPHQSDNFDIHMSRSLEGIGAVLQLDQDYTKVVRLVAGGPADNSKQLHPADKIIGVAQGEDGEMVNVYGWRLEEVVNLIRGNKGTTVRLQIIPSATTGGQTSKEISIVRNRVLLKDQLAEKRIIDVDNKGAISRIGIINIPDFYFDWDAYQRREQNYVSTTRDVARLLEELKQEKVDGVIIDLRNNGGGSLTEANSLVGLFINRGATVQIKDHKGNVNVISDHDPSVAYSGPLAVLVNRLSASASEIFAGAIQDYQRGIIIGGQTFGKGTVQTLIPLRQGKLKITQSKFYRVSGETTQYQGVLPDIDLPPFIDLNEIGENVLENALPWDTIRPVLHRKTGKIAPYIAQLKSLHEERIEKNPDFQFRLSQIEKIKENREKSDVSLNENLRRNEQSTFKQWQLSAENQRRQAKGLPPFEELPEASTEESEDISTSDPYLMEGAHILTDYIDLTKEQVAQYL
ncbi:MAG: carboxy terminal-processing peptidase [Pseudomonadales bacterium]|jgi:carboxyl-terminal processing protease